MSPSVLNSRSKDSLNQVRGFTFLELIFVVAIVAIVSGAVYFLVNPAETLRRSRDVQRMSDLASIVVAIEEFRASVPDADKRYDGAVGANECDGPGFMSNDRWISFPTPITDSEIYQGNQVITSSSQAVNGTGWLPVALTAIPSGSPISSYPRDPRNSIANTTQVTQNDLIYIYACREAGSGAPAFEIVANLESRFYSNGGVNDKESKDGGNYNEVYEVGSLLTIMRDFTP